MNDRNLWQKQNSEAETKQRLFTELILSNKKQNENKNKKSKQIKSESEIKNKLCRYSYKEKTNAEYRTSTIKYSKCWKKLSTSADKSS